MAAVDGGNGVRVYGGRGEARDEKFSKGMGFREKNELNKMMSSEGIL